eukprot:Plantae.Rhodophyta-Purpureofilum_apyrenoidigerum.ctg13652.p1 GENE.Plantae.Rhodophyta-Purpureofilum_apyrenoidigerum.ctg13652~~Plantae.Rhodophyta-Purpureofilum_apyrenoidigerum.ctg13652.p1  ORF type:complete len:219 (+),score=53.52 Plantae.Rhodophyta-Purpureofilum_apyrenoidigerum.ctg13652:85-741(+)
MTSMNALKQAFLPVGPGLFHRGQSVTGQCRYRCRPRACSVEQPATPTTATNVKQVSLRRPMGIVFEQTESNIVFVSEVLPDSNAAESGKIDVADEVIAVSLPFGEELTICEGEGLELFQSFVKERDSAEEFIKLELRPFEGGLVALQNDHGDFLETHGEDVEAFKKKLCDLPYLEADDDEEEADPDSSHISELELMLSKMSTEEKVEWFMKNYTDPGE